MIIAVDLDGVVFDFANPCNEWLRFQSGHHHSVNVRDWYKQYPDGDTLFGSFWRHVGENEGWWENCPLIDGAKQGLLKLNDRGHDVFFLTARNPKYRAVTRRILDAAGLDAIPLHMARDKDTHPYDVLIDDWSRHLPDPNNEFEERTGILFAQPWNRGEGWVGLEAADWDAVVAVVDALSHPAERRVVNAETGGEKGTKPARFDLLPPRALWRIAEHFGRGAEKYADRNWEKGYDWSLSYAALQRHLNAWWAGEDKDTDPAFGEYSHLDAAAFHILVLMSFEDWHPNLDDRSTHRV